MFLKGFSSFAVTRLMILCFMTFGMTACSSSPNAALDLSAINAAVMPVEVQTPLMKAAAIADVSGIREALAKGESVNAYTQQASALSLALKNGHYTLAKFLVRAGADANLGFLAGEPSAMILAADVAQNELVTALIVQGYDIDYTDARGYSALAVAAIGGHLTTLNILLNAGADVDVAPEQRSILMHAVADENTLIAQQLIAACADVNSIDQSGETALSIARQAGFFDLDLMLVQAGARL
jgi:hypothetical protein